MRLSTIIDNALQAGIPRSRGRWARGAPPATPARLTQAELGRRSPAPMSRRSSSVGRYRRSRPWPARRAPGYGSRPLAAGGQVRVGCAGGTQALHAVASAGRIGAGPRADAAGVAAPAGRVNQGKPPCITSPHADGRVAASSSTTPRSPVTSGCGWPARLQEARLTQQQLAAGRYTKAYRQRARDRDLEAQLDGGAPLLRRSARRARRAAAAG